MNKTAIITGATGLTGTELLNQLLRHSDYAKVIVLVRRPLDINNPKLIQKVIDYEQLPEAIKDISADDGYCCLGTTIRTAGSKERQYRIDHDYVVMSAQAFHDAGVKRFAVVSSIGADKDSGNFYLRTKGQMEEDLKAIPFEGLFIFRPSFLLGDRKEFRFGEKAAKVLLLIFTPLMAGRLRKYRGINVSVVAAGMIRRVCSELTGTAVIESDSI